MNDFNKNIYSPCRFGQPSVGFPQECCDLQQQLHSHHFQSCWTFCTSRIDTDCSRNCNRVLIIKSCCIMPLQRLSYGGFQFTSCSFFLIRVMQMKCHQPDLSKQYSKGYLDPRRPLYIMVLVFQWLQGASVVLDLWWG